MRLVSVSFAEVLGFADLDFCLLIAGDFFCAGAFRVGLLAERFFSRTLFFAALLVDALFFFVAIELCSLE